MSDWNRLRAFVGVADAGSLSAAARTLAISQPTLSRHIQGLEHDLGVLLFERTKRGLAITETGLELLEHARPMAEAAARVSLVAQGRAQRVAGVVRVTASEVVAHYVLPEIVAQLRGTEPKIELEVVASNSTENLLQREADIAVRMYRPAQADVTTQKVADLPLGAFASPAYLRARGSPENMEALLEHTVIGYDRSDEMLRGFAAAGVAVDREFFPIRTDNHLVVIRLAQAGAGIGFISTHVATRELAMERILPELPLAPLPIWLTAHAELKTSRRIRIVFDALAAGLKAYFD